MSVESFTIHDEDSGPVTIKLSQSGRISLSDITAATIGNLETWTDPNSEPATTDSVVEEHTDLAVLRPWEDPKLMKQETSGLPNLDEQENSTSCQSVQNSSVSNNTDHIKRQLEEFYNIAEGPQWKRPKHCERKENSLIARHPFKTENWNPAQENHGTRKAVVQNFNSFAYSALIQDQKCDNYAYPSLSELCETHVSNSSSKWTESPSNCTDTNRKSFTKQYTGINKKSSSIGSITDFYKFHFKQKDTHSMFHGMPTADLKNSCPTTPVAKRQNLLPSYNMYDSPGLESRFNESLSNLIGSPPPDSPLAKNPIFNDLQTLLSRECKSEFLPKTLFGIHDNIQKPVEQEENIFVRERKLHDRFNDLQAANPDEVRNLSSIFRYQTAMIETERFRTLHESQYPREYKASVNQFYDKKIHKVIDRVEQSVILLENTNRENASKKMVVKPRPHLNREAVQLMENWYRTNMEHPYPTNTTIELLANNGNISTDQVKKWFANKRNRSQNTRTLTEIANKKRKLGHLIGSN